MGAGTRGRRRSALAGWLAAALVGSLLAGCSSSTEERATGVGLGADNGEAAASSGNPSSLLSNLPLDFIENQGQWGSSTKFAARHGSLSASFEDRAIQLRLAGGASLALAFEDASRSTNLVGEAERSGTYNFFTDKDASRWLSEVPAYKSILYDGLYPGIDVRVREGLHDGLEYDLLLEPGADLGRAVVRARGASDQHPPD